MKGTEENIRYDPLYRVIDETEEIRVIEGNFKGFFDRLKKINSLGVIPEVIEMANYSKYEHSLGTVHQTNIFLQIMNDKIPSKYHLPLKISANFLHSGHLPFTYSTERALLLACNLGNRNSTNPAKAYVDRKSEKILKVLELKKEQIEGIKQELYSLRSHRDLYKYFSAEIILDKWNGFSNKFSQELTDDDKIIIIGNLIDPRSYGYQYLKLIDKVDYVQRDALYFGTVRLDISPKHLYSKNIIDIPLYSDEIQLIDINLAYLQSVFYNDLNVIYFTRLYEKILAALILSKKFQFKWLHDYDDYSFKWLICKNINKQNKKVKLPSKWIEKADLLFNQKYQFTNVFELFEVQFFKDVSIIDIEYNLIGKKGSINGLLAYPFEIGVLISVDYADEDFQILEMQNIAISVFLQKEAESLSPLMKIIKNICHTISLDNVQIIREGLGDLISWNGECEINNSPVVKSIALALLNLEEKEKKHGDFIRKYIISLADIAEYKQLWADFNLDIWKQVITEKLDKARKKPDFNELEAYQGIVQGLLTLPIKLLQFKSSLKWLDKIYNEIAKNIESCANHSEKGSHFEALCLIDRIRTKNGTFQFFINDLIITNSNKSSSEKDNNEFDIIEMRLNNNSSEIWIYECSISDDYQNINKKKLTELADEIGKKFPAQTIRTRYLIPTNKQRSDWTPKEIDAGRNFH